MKTGPSVYDAVAEILMYDGMINPDDAYHYAFQVNQRTQHLLDIGQYGSAETIVGNTLIKHRSIAYLPPAWWTLRRWIKSLIHVHTRYHICMCGWNGQECIEYHQADMINEAMLRYQHDLVERESQQ